jgi:hypothetical protein
MGIAASSLNLFGSLVASTQTSSNVHATRRSKLSQQWVGAKSSPSLLGAKVLQGEKVFPPDIQTNPPAELKLGPLDGFSLRLWYVESTHFYDRRLDVAAIRRSLEGMLALYPSFGGHARKPHAGSFTGMDHAKPTLWSGYSVITDADGGIPLVQIEMPGTAADAANSKELRQSRGLANIPNLGYIQGKYLFDENSPLMTVTVVHFTNGGSALGIAINHGLVDGCGYAMLLKAWSFAHVHGWEHPDTPVLQCERPPCLLAEANASSTVRCSSKSSGEEGGPLPTTATATATTSPVTKPSLQDEAYTCDVRTTRGLTSYLLTFEPWVWNTAGQPRARVFFSWSELKTMKETTPCMVKGQHLTPSSSAALGARLWIAFAELLLPMPQPLHRQVQPYVVAEMRAPRNQKIAPGFLGNCMDQLRSDLVGDTANLGAMCGGFQAASSMLLDHDVLKALTDTMLEETVVDVGRGLWGKISQLSATLNPNSSTHACGINALQSFRLMGLDFGAGDCIGYIPYNIGSRLQMDEALGGMHVYLQPPMWAASTAPTDWIARTESASFRARVLNLGGGNVAYSGAVDAPTGATTPLNGRESVLRKQSFTMFPRHSAASGYVDGGEEDNNEAPSDVGQGIAVRESMRRKESVGMRRSSSEKLELISEDPPWDESGCDDETSGSETGHADDLDQSFWEEGEDDHTREEGGQSSPVRRQIIFPSVAPQTLSVGISTTVLSTRTLASVSSSLLVQTDDASSMRGNVDRYLQQEDGNFDADAQAHDLNQPPHHQQQEGASQGQPSESCLIVY